jgi:hypothetical protein
MMVLTDKSYEDESLAEGEAPYLFDGEVPASDKPGVFNRLSSRLKGGNLHPDANNKEVSAPPLEDE